MPYASKLRVPVESLPAVILGRYGLDVEVTGVRPGYFSTVAELSSGGERYILKVYVTDEVDRHGLAGGLSVCLRYSAAGIPVPEPEETVDGSLFAQTAGNTLVLLPFLDGAPFEPGNVDQLQSAARTLGRMHRVGGIPAEQRSMRSDQEAHRTFRDVERTLAEFQRRQIAAPRRVAELLEACVRRLRGASGLIHTLPTAFIHGDYRAQNLLFTGGEVSAVLDTDNARIAPRLQDLAYAAVFFQAVLADAPLDPDEYEAFLVAYRSQVALDVMERTHLPAHLCLAWMKGMLLWLKIGWLAASNDRAQDWVGNYLPLGTRLLRELD